MLRVFCDEIILFHTITVIKKYMAKVNDKNEFQVMLSLKCLFV